MVSPNKPYYFHLTDLQTYCFYRDRWSIGGGQIPLVFNVFQMYFCILESAFQFFNSFSLMPVCLYQRNNSVKLDAVTKELKPFHFNMHCTDHMLWLLVHTHYFDIIDVSVWKHIHFIYMKAVQWLSMYIFCRINVSVYYFYGSSYSHT